VLLLDFTIVMFVHTVQMFRMSQIETVCPITYILLPKSVEALYSVGF